MPHALEAYNEGVDEKAELEKAKEELQDLELAAKSETFSPTNAYASDAELIVGTYINKVGGAITINSDPLQEYQECFVKLKPIFDVLN